MELTEYGAQDIWNQNKPDEVRSKYNLSELIRMLKDENGGELYIFLSITLAAVSTAKRRQQESGVVSMVRELGPSFSPGS